MSLFYLTRYICRPRATAEPGFWTQPPHTAETALAHGLADFVVLAGLRREVLVYPLGL